jgi:hypothetical protein
MDFAHPSEETKYKEDEEEIDRLETASDKAHNKFKVE